MAYAGKLCNPTPWDVRLDWGNRGQRIRIPAFGDKEITAEQQKDYTPGTPGEDAVYSELNYYGVFLLDIDRPYDNQALEALEKARQARKEKYDTAVRRMMDRRAQMGVSPDPEALEESVRQMGLADIRSQVKTLEAQIDKLRSLVGPEKRVARPKLDPARTVYVLDPPREFPSVAAMEFYLELNPEIAARHEAFKTQAASE